MADTALIHLAPGAFHQPLAQAPVLFQAAPDEAPQDTTLAGALAAAAGGDAHLVVTSTEALLTEVALSRKQARHLQRVLPYLLEEQLLDAPEALWFATGKAEQGRYPAAVIDRGALDALLALCHEQQVHPLGLKVDADLLAPLAPLVIGVPGRSALIAGRDQALAAQPEQIETLLALHPPAVNSDDDDAAMAAPDTAPGAPALTRLDDAGTLCASLRDALSRGRGVDLLQGAYAQRKTSAARSSAWTPWRPVIGLAAAVFIVALASLWVQEWRYSKAAEDSFRKAAGLYTSLFPDDRATLALRRQFQARLANLSDGGQQQGSALFAMLPAVASTLSGSAVKPKRLQFDSRDGSLLLDLGAKQYSDLEKLQAALREKGVQASIANYRNGTNGVTARIKVEQAG